MSYSKCKWCLGRGCIYCEAERDKDIAKRTKPEPTPDPASNLTGMLGAINKMLDDELEKEVIGGASVLSVRDYVGLDIAFSPVLQRPFQELSGIDAPAEAIATEGGKSWILRPMDGGPEEIVGAESMKIMRGRFLLVKGLYYKRLMQDSFAHGDKQKVISWYFGGSVWVPPEGELKEAMLR